MTQQHSVVGRSLPGCCFIWRGTGKGTHVHVTNVHVKTNDLHPKANMLSGATRVAEDRQDGETLGRGVEGSKS